MSVVVYDLDSTLADTRHRHHLSPHNADKSTWDEYALGCGGDTPIQGTIRLGQVMKAAGHQNFILSGRPESARKLTTEWLAEHQFPWDVMRLIKPEEGMLPHVAYKTSVVQGWLDKGHDIILAVEDWAPLVDAYEALGVPTLCINPRYQDDPMAFFASVPDNPTTDEERAAFQRALSDVVHTEPTQTVTGEATFHE